MRYFIEPIPRITSAVARTSYSFRRFTPPANVLLTVWVWARGVAAAGSVSGGGLTWTLQKSLAYDVDSIAHLFTAPTGDSPASTLITFSTSGGAAASVIASCIQINNPEVNGQIAVRQIGSEDGAVGYGLQNPAVNFPYARLATDDYIIGLGINRDAPGSTAPTGWTEMFQDGIGGGGASIAYRKGGETGTTARFTAADGNWAVLGLVLAGRPGTLEQPCGPLDHDYTIGTFDLYLAEIADDGTVGPDELVGNISTGTLDDDTEDFDGFATSGSPNEPGSISIRTAVRLPFTTDEITCANLTRLFSVAPALAEGADRFGFDAVTKRKIYRATLEHIMPCGHAITVRLHRACVVNRASWAFSADAVHALQFELKAFPDDAEANPFGYLERIPDECAVS